MKKDYALDNVIYCLCQQSRANNYKVTGLIRPEFELVCDLMPVLVQQPASLTKIRSIMNVLAWRHHFPIIVYKKFFQCSRAHNTEVNDPIRLEFKLI